MLRAIVLDVFQGDRNFTPHMEKAVRVYLAVHQVAIKLLATFRHGLTDRCKSSGKQIGGSHGKLLSA